MTARSDATPIRHVVRVEAPIDIVRGYFTDPERIAQWWPTRAAVDPRVGGELTLDFDQPDGRTDRARGTFVELTRDRIVLTWGFERDADLPPGSSRVEINLEPDGQATIVRLEHQGLPESHRRRHAEGLDFFPRPPQVRRCRGVAGP